MSRRRRIVIAMIAPLLIAAAVVASGLRANWTASAPLGLWRISSDRPTLGAMVLICPPALDWIAALPAQNMAAPGYCASGTVPFIKRVAALPGSHYAITDTGVRIDGELVAGSTPISASLIAGARSGVIEQGEALFLNTDHPQSIDSRYFGPLALEGASTLVPVWTW